MRIDNDGLSLWYGTPDAPVPPDDGADCANSSMTVAVRPPSDVNRVTVHYRVDQGVSRILQMRSLSTDYARGVQYFFARFPRLDPATTVQYYPTVECAGRRSPPAANVQYSTFRTASVAPRTMPVESGANEQEPRFVPETEFVTSVKTTYSKNADVLGPTPDGLRINYYLAGGRATGPRLNATELPRGGDFLTIRRDGIAVVSVRAVFRSDNDALIGAEVSGRVDMGEDAYVKAVAGNLPESATLQLAVILSTADERYLWVNRCQFMAVGQLYVAEAAVHYDVFALRNASHPFC